MTFIESEKSIYFMMSIILQRVAKPEKMSAFFALHSFALSIIAFCELLKCIMQNMRAESVKYCSAFDAVFSLPGFGIKAHTHNPMLTLRGRERERAKNIMILFCLSSQQRDSFCS